MTETTRSGSSVGQDRLYLALELSATTWVLGFSSGLGVAPRIRAIRSGDWEALTASLAWAREQWGLPADVRVESCYEAGRDGFWIHRQLAACGIHNRVVDSSSIEVNRRARRTKTDRIDALKLVQMLMRVTLGERRVWSEVRVPSGVEEAARHASRERSALVEERTRLVNQIRGWLATCGVRLPSRRRAAWWTRLGDAAGLPLGEALQARVRRAAARWQLLEEQLAAIAVAQRAAVAAAPADDAGRQLVRLKGVGVTAAATLLEEGLVWRQFRNRRQVGGFIGLVTLPYASGDTHRDQGTRGSGHRRLKTVAIQLAWNWVRWQPHSALAQWYGARFGTGKRARRIGIVALARQLMIALWRYVTQQVVPTGAVMGTAG